MTTADFHALERRHSGYRLLPFRFARIPGIGGEVFLSSETGQFVFLPESAFDDFVAHRLSGEHPRFQDLEARHFLYREGGDPHIEAIAAQYRTRKSFLKGGPGLFLFVVTLRCDHSCPYCQVSRQDIGSSAFNMSREHAAMAIERLFESPARQLTVEIQGGEPLLAFDRIREIIERIVERNAMEGRSINFVVATTLHLLDESMLKFFRQHGVRLSTSLDGPDWLHNSNRPNRTRDSYQRTISAIRRAREALGPEAVAALTTLTRKSLSAPKEIIDEYVEQGFRSIFLRPLSKYGFAAKTHTSLGYSMTEFLAFYQTAFDYLLELNAAGVVMDEVYACLLLNNILTPFPTNYVDLRSPAGAALGALVFNYDGSVYASDESRMLAEMGDYTFRLGSVSQPYHELMTSDAVKLILASGISESLPGCSDCAFLPYCGADPVEALAVQGDPVGHRPTSPFCAKQTGLFHFLLRVLHKRDPEVMRVILGWLGHRHPRSIADAGWVVH